jgi:hypothetical protein
VEVLELEDTLTITNDMEKMADDDTMPVTSVTWNDPVMIGPTAIGVMQSGRIMSPPRG